MGRRNIYIEDSFEKEVIEYCKNTGRKVSPLIEVALEEYINNHP